MPCSSKAASWRPGALLGSQCWLASSWVPGPLSVPCLETPDGAEVKITPWESSACPGLWLPCLAHPPPSGGSLKVTARELFVETLLRVPNSLDVQLPSVLKPWWWFLPEPWGWEWPSSLALNLPQEHWTCKAQAGIHTSFLYSFSTVRSMLCTRLSLKNSSGTCHYPRRGLGYYMRLSQARPLPFKDR